MKKFLIILGAIFLTLIALGVVAFVLTAIRGTALDKESKAYVDTAVPAIVSSWSVQALLDRASSEFTQATQPGDVDRFFGTFRQLGQMRLYKGSQGQALMYRDLAKGETISAAYTANAEFENGSAEIDVKLIKHGDHWQILGFNVKPTSQLHRSNQALQSTAARSDA